MAALSDYLVPKKGGVGSKKEKKDKKESNSEEAMGEYASVMEGEYHEFVVFEIEKVDE